MAKVTDRLEKHKGFTLMVKEEWATVVLDGTGYAVEGPVASDAEVVEFARASIPFLQKLALTLQLEKL
jgi:hypothetical protein